MKKNAYYLAIGVIGLVITTIGVSAIVSADEPNRQFDPERKEQMMQHKEEMKEIMESGDYDAWVAKMTEFGKMDPEMINEDTFSKLLEMHSLMQSGDKEGAKAIADELGLKRPGKGMKGPGFQKAYDKGFADGQATCQN